MAFESHRYFRTSPAVYEAVRAQLDAAFGHPDGRALTCMPPAADAPQVPDSPDVMVPVLHSMTEWPEVAPQISALLAAGQITELTAAEYAALLPTPTLPT